MKTLKILFIATLLISLTAFSQTTKGNFLVGGKGYLYKYTSKNAIGIDVQSGTQISLQPNIGYFFINNLAVGLNSSLVYSKTKGNSTSNTGYGLGPFIRYYFLKYDKNINFLLEVNYNYLKEFKNPDFGNSYGIKTGPVIYFNSSVGLEFLLIYNHNYYSSDSFTTNDFQLGIGFQIHLEKNN